MQNNLFLKRLRIITLNNEVAYDEQFHEGVNIIRGRNSSGKSTIVRFIFYALGGCYFEFVPEALKCREVFAEVLINGDTTLTLCRKIDITNGKVNQRAPMYIYIGGMDESLKPENKDKWNKYGYMSTSQNFSFSNILFKFMGLPEFKADSNITMHQILRLIYLDQESPLGSLFYFDQFDKEITRETVAELLMGLYDEKLSNAKLDKIDTERKIVETKREIKITGSFFSNPKTRSSKFIHEQIDSITAEISNITTRILSLRCEQIQTQRSKQKMKFEYESAIDRITRLRKEQSTLQEKVQKLNAEIQDSKYFIETLQKKREDINHSIATREYFDNLHLEYCPECLSKITDNVPKDHCRLCKSPIDNSRGVNQARRIKLELEYQIRESKKILQNDIITLQERKSALTAKKRELNTAQRLYNDIARNVRSTQEEEIDKLIQDKGFKEGEILQYQTMLENAEKYEQLEKNLKDLEHHNDELKRYIEAKEAEIRKKRIEINKHISDNGVYLLHHDVVRQKEFKSATGIYVDYKQNLAYISGHRTKLSASSNFYLKLSARYAMFFSSLQLDSMKYPRLMFTDNMEDKGIESGRAKNLQLVIVNRLKELAEAKEPHPSYQLIFATSYINEDLDKPEYTIGDFYTPDNKSLKNVDF